MPPRLASAISGLRQAATETFRARPRSLRRSSRSTGEVRGRQREEPVTAATSAPGTPRHVDLGPLRIFDGGFDQAVAFLADAVEQRSGARVATANLDFIAIARRDRQLTEDLANSDLVVADGVPVVLLARLMGARGIERCTGVDLAPAICRAISERLGRVRVVMYGSSPEITARAAARLEHDVPGAEVCLRLHPPFREVTEAERAAEQDRIRDVGPDVVFVALGCPRQERRIQEYYAAAPGAAWIGVGGTIDFLAGERRRAPRLVQRFGLEWAFRMAQEPRRLASRYLVRDVPALFAVSAWCVRRRVVRNTANVG